MKKELSESGKQSAITLVEAVGKERAIRVLTDNLIMHELQINLINAMFPDKIAHQFAELMAMYALDAAETTQPWRLWECKNNRGVDCQWHECEGHPNWVEHYSYRRKQ